MNTLRRAPHANAAAISEFIGRSPFAEWGRRTRLAVEAELSPATVRDLASGRRLGTNPEVRRQLADALDVPVSAITCYCPRPDGRCVAVTEDAA